MKKCQGCGKELLESARFCTGCGANVSNEAVTTSSVNPGEPVQPSAAAVKTAESVQQIEGIAKSYFKNLNASVKYPKLTAKGENYNGVISYALISLFMSLGLSHLTVSTLNSGFNMASNFMGMGNSNVSANMPMFPGWINIFLFFAISGVIPVFLSFFVTSKTFGEGYSVLGVFNRIYTPASIAVYISLAVLVLSFIVGAFGSFWVMLLAGAVFFIVNTSFVASLWNGTTTDNSPVHFYKVAGMLVLNGVLITVVASIFVSSVFSSLF